MVHCQRTVLEHVLNGPNFQLIHPQKNRVISPSPGRVTVREVGLGSRQSHGPTLRGQQVGHELHPVLPVPGEAVAIGMPWAMAAHGERSENHGKTIRKTRREKLRDGTDEI